LIENVADVAAVTDVSAHGPDANNVISRGNVAACIYTQCDVITASRIVIERMKTFGCVTLARRIPTKRPITAGGVPGPA